ncbi:uncharacterized protein [Apostichopus japonicus]|uniref:uncharacterized protein n=1 Tax=Stichopus japonicus TaxID=307972 RepID=UPI003AB11FEE
MAAAKVLDDIDEKFCQCCVCFEQYKKPRQLQCLHRYCTECLEKMIAKESTDFKCPLCQEKIEVPENGVEGFKSDFYMNEILDYIKVKKSLKEDQILTCGDCSKQTKSSAYCFKCTGFLCEDCHTYHLSRKSLQEHRPHILSLEGVEAKNITLEKLSILKEAPRCQTHSQNQSQLCCKSCENRPICLTCTYGEHRNHDMYDVTELAKSEREKLKGQLKALDQWKNGIYETFSLIKMTEDEICSNAAKHLEESTKKYNKTKGSLESTERDIQRKIEVEENEIKRKLEENISRKDKGMEREIQQIREKYEIIEINHRTEAAQKSDALKTRSKQAQDDANAKRNRLALELQKVCTEVESEKREKLLNWEKFSSSVNSTVRKFENVTNTAENVLSSQDDWTAVHSIEAISKATEPLIQEMKRDYSNVAKLAIYVERQQEQEHLCSTEATVVHIDYIKAPGMYINSIACTWNGRLVISGGTSEKQNYISSMDMTGKIVSSKLGKHFNSVLFSPGCYCAPVNKLKIAVACQEDGIALFDISDGSYLNNHLGDFIRGCSRSKLRVACIAMDTVSNSIILGIYNNRNLYVLDESLNYKHTIRLPEIIAWPVDLIVHNSNIFVCDKEGRQAWAINMEGEEIHDFQKPEVSNKCNIPVSVCSDGKGFIYILWREEQFSCEQRCVVAQYRGNNSDITMEFLPFFSDAVSLCVASDSKFPKSKPKLVVITFRSARMHIFDLNGN